MICETKRYKKDLFNLIKLSQEDNIINEIVFRTKIDENGKKHKDEYEFLLSLNSNNKIMTFEISVIGIKYPWESPSIKVMSLFFHPNIIGDTICLDILKSEWKPTMNLVSIVQSIVSFIDIPNEKDPLNCIVNQIYIKHRNKYNIYCDYIGKKYMDSKSYEIIKKDFIDGTNEYKKLLPIQPTYEIYNGKEIYNYKELIKIMDKIIKFF
jgi:ubiquitin-protein ligase